MYFVLRVVFRTVGSIRMSSPTGAAAIEKRAVSVFFPFTASRVCVCVCVCVRDTHTRVHARYLSGPAGGGVLVGGGKCVCVCVFVPPFIFDVNTTAVDVTLRQSRPLGRDSVMTSQRRWQ